MTSRIIAGIDIGTNTLLMVIGKKNIDSNSIEILHDAHNIARLGEGVHQTRMISPEALHRAKSILREYRLVCESYRVTEIHAVATSAMRDALNREEVLQELSEELGSTIIVISGEEEAKITFRGTVSDNEKTLVIDIGGGSTELVLGENHLPSSRISLDIGAVRLSELCFRNQLPASDEDRLYAQRLIVEHLTKNAVFIDALTSQSGCKVVCVAGTPTTLACIDLGLHEFSVEKVNRHTITYSRLQELNTYISSLTRKELAEHPSIHSKRGDILPMGTLILLSICTVLSISEFSVSTKGLRFGLLQ